MANTDKPQCSRCFGQNWIDLGKATPRKGEIDLNEGEVVTPEREPHWYQCGGGEAHSEPVDMRQGCMRVIRATPEEMSKGGVI